MATPKDINNELTPVEEGTKVITPVQTPAPFAEENVDMAAELNPPATPLPSTAENQEETEKIVSFEQEVFNKQKELKKNFGKDVSFQEAQQQLVLEKSQQAEEQKAREAAEQAEQQEAERLELEKINAELDAYEQAKERAKELGLPFREDEAKEAVLAERTKELEIDAASVSENEDAMRDAITANEDEVKGEIRNQRALNKQIRAAQIANEEQAQRNEIDVQKAEEEAETTVKAVEKDLEEFEGGIFGGMSGSNKVLAAISIALAGIGKGLTGSSENAAISILQKAAGERAANYRKQKQLNYQQEAAAKEAYYKNARLAIDKQKARINNAQSIAQLNKLNQEIANLEIQERRKIARAKLIEAGKNVPSDLLNPEDLKRAKELRSEYNTQVKDLGTNEILSQYRQIKNFQENPSPAGDIGLIFSYMKVLDPRSVVREGEFALASNAGGVPEKIRNIYNKTIEGTRLTPSQRRDFTTQAKNIVESKMKTHSEVNQKYRNLSKQYGIPSNLVVSQPISFDKLDPNEGNILKLQNLYEYDREKAIEVLKKSNKWFEEQ